MRCGDDGRGTARRAGKFALAAVVALGAGSLHGEPAAVDWKTPWAAYTTLKYAIYGREPSVETVHEGLATVFRKAVPIETYERMAAERQRLRLGEEPFFLWEENETEPEYHEGPGGTKRCRFWILDGNRKRVGDEQELFEQEADGWRWIPNSRCHWYPLPRPDDPNEFRVSLRPALIAALSGNDPMTRIHAAEVLIETDRATALGAVTSLTDAADANLRFAAGRFLVEHGEKSGIPVLIGLLTTGRRKDAGDLLNKVTGLHRDLPFVYASADLERYVNRWRQWWSTNKDCFVPPGKGGGGIAGAAGDTALAGMPPELRREVERLVSPDPRERLLAARAVGDLGLQAAPAIPALIRLLGDTTIVRLSGVGEPKDPFPGSSAARALEKMGPPAVDPLIRELKTNPKTRLLVMSALGGIKDPRAVEPLIDLLGVSTEQVRGHARDALERITGQALGEDPVVWKTWWQQNRERLLERGGRQGS